MIVDTFDHQLPIARANIDDIVRMRDDPRIILYAHMPCEDCSHEEMQLMHILTAEDWDLIERFSYEPTVTNEHALIKVYMRFNEALDVGYITYPLRSHHYWKNPRSSSQLNLVFCSKIRVHLERGMKYSNSG
jgi:hypothetical protein